MPSASAPVFQAGLPGTLGHAVDGRGELGQQGIAVDAEAVGHRARAVGVGAVGHGQRDRGAHLLAVAGRDQRRRQRREVDAAGAEQLHVVDVPAVTDDRAVGGQQEAQAQRLAGVGAQVDGDLMPGGVGAVVAGQRRPGAVVGGDLDVAIVVTGLGVVALPELERRRVVGPVERRRGEHVVEIVAARRVGQGQRRGVRGGRGAPGAARERPVAGAEREVVEEDLARRADHERHRVGDRTAAPARGHRDRHQVTVRAARAHGERNRIRAERGRTHGRQRGDGPGRLRELHVGVVAGEGQRSRRSGSRSRRGWTP